MFLGNIIEVSIFFIIGVLISGGILIYWILMYYLCKPKKVSEQTEEVVEQQQAENKLSEAEKVEEKPSIETKADDDYDNVVADTMANGKEITSEISNEVR